MNNICDEHGAVLSCDPHGLICPLYTNTKNDLSPVHKYKNRRMQTVSCTNYIYIEEINVVSLS